MSGGEGLERRSLVWNGSYSSAYQDWLGIQADAPSPLTNSLAGHKRRRRSIKEHFELGTPVPKTLRRNYLRLFLDGLSQQLDGLDGRGLRWPGGCWDVELWIYFMIVQTKECVLKPSQNLFLNSVRPSSTVYMKWLWFVQLKWILSPNLVYYLRHSFCWILRKKSSKLCAFFLHSPYK